MAVTSTLISLLLSLIIAVGGTVSGDSAGSSLGDVISSQSPSVQQSLNGVIPSNFLSTTVSQSDVDTVLSLPAPPNLISVTNAYIDYVRNQTGIDISSRLVDWILSNQNNIVVSDTGTKTAVLSTPAGDVTVTVIGLFQMRPGANDYYLYLSQKCTDYSLYCVLVSQKNSSVPQPFEYIGFPLFQVTYPDGTTYYTFEYFGSPSFDRQNTLSTTPYASETTFTSDGTNLILNSYYYSWSTRKVLTATSVIDVTKYADNYDGITAGADPSIGTVTIDGVTYTINPDGSITLADGTVIPLNPDGTYTLPNGAVGNPDIDFRAYDDTAIMDLLKQILDAINNKSLVFEQNPVIPVPEVSVTYDGVFSEFLLNSQITQFFPFCLPFDLVRGVKLFSVTPKTPHFKYTFDYPMPNGKSVKIDFDFDLSPYEDLAAITRWFSTVWFAVTLIFVSTKIVKGAGA